MPRTKREEVGTMVRDMCTLGIYELSNSPWASPVILVKKKDDSTRFYEDYRKLNVATQKGSYPLTRIDDTLDTLSGAKWFSALDLESRYWQLEIHFDDEPKRQFTTGKGLWQFKCCAVWIV